MAAASLNPVGSLRRSRVVGLGGIAGALMLLVVVWLLGADRTHAATISSLTARFLAPIPATSSQPSAELIGFLLSPAGLVAAALAALALAIGAGAIAYSQLRVRPGSDQRRKRRGRSNRNARRDRPAEAPPRVNAPVIAATLAAGCFILPLIFTIALEDVFAQPKTWFLWGLAALIGILIIHAAWRGARPVGSSLIDLAAAAFVLFNLTATILSANPGHSLIGERQQYQGLLTMTAYVVLFYGARYAVTDAGHVRVLSLALIVSAIAVSTYGLAQWLGLDPIWSELWKGRIFSTMGQANMLAAFLATAIVMAIPLAAARGRIRRAFLIIGVAGAVLTLAMTFGRGGYLALASGLTVAGIVLIRGVRPHILRRYAPRVAGVIVAALVVTAALAVAWRPAGRLVTRVADRAASIVDTSESSNRIRLDLWAVAVKVAADHPLVGTGPDSYVLVFPGYRDAVLPPDRAQDLAQFRVESPHNVYLAVAAGAGLAAIAALTILLGAALWLGARAAWGEQAVRDRLALAGLMAGTTVVLVANAFMTGESATSAIWFIVVGALVGVASSQRPSVPPS